MRGNQTHEPLAQAREPGSVPGYTTPVLHGNREVLRLDRAKPRDVDALSIQSITQMNFSVIDPRLAISPGGVFDDIS